MKKIIRNTIRFVYNCEGFEAGLGYNKKSIILHFSLNKID